MKRLLITLLLVWTSWESAGADLIIWANNGEDKVTRDDLRANANASAVHNSAWNGSAISIFGARNEMVAFNLILESAATPIRNVRVAFNSLTGPGGAVIRSKAVGTQNNGEALFGWTDRNIELFYVRYLQIEGISLFGYEASYYDERKAPKRFQRPGRNGYIGVGTWHDRPDADKYYPDIAVPLELHTPFEINANQNQSIWSDIYIPKTAPAGTYNGAVTVTYDTESGERTQQIPVVLVVRDFSLPDLPSGKTMLFGAAGQGDIAARYTGTSWLDEGSAAYQKALKIASRHAQLAHRHKISLMRDAPTPQGLDQIAIDNLTGDLFTAARGYDGPGVGVGANVLSIGTYGSWQSAWLGGLSTDIEKEQAMRQHSDAWVNFLTQQNLKTPTEYFLYLIDESGDHALQEKWAGWLKSNPGPGRQLKSFSTASAPWTQENIPSLDIACSVGGILDVLGTWEQAAAHYIKDPDKRLYFYNGDHAVSGSFLIDEVGVALRVKSWTQFKLGIDRWFYWESTYYNDFQSGSGETDLFTSARTFGLDTRFDETGTARGRTGWNYSNGDGVLFYPGTDYINGTLSTNNYNIDGPFASLRLKYWRRGIQDMDYLTMAAKIDAEKVKGIVNRIIPKTLWEYGCGDDCEPSDPTWARFGPSWSDDPDVWEAARSELADVIDTSGSDGTDTQPPSPPTQLRVVKTDADRARITWQASTDNLAVTGYKVYRDNTVVSTVSGTSAVDSGLGQGSTFNYHVKAFDAAGNLSESSQPATLDMGSAEIGDTGTGGAGSGSGDAGGGTGTDDCGAGGSGSGCFIEVIAKEPLF